MKTTARDFAYFKARCEHWQERLGLTDWELRFEHCVEDSDSLAAVRRDVEQRLALIRLYSSPTKDGIEPPGDTLEFCARHEVLHILLAELDDLARSRVNPAPVWEAAEHAVIRRLEKVL